MADDRQGMGLAHTLLARLASHAALSGIRRMTADAVACNTAMIRLAQRSGFSITRKQEDDRLVHLVKDLIVHGTHTSNFRPRLGERIISA